MLKHLGGEIGARRNVLIEIEPARPHGGLYARALRRPVTPGEIVPVTIAGHDGKELLAA